MKKEFLLLSILLSSCFCEIVKDLPDYPYKGRMFSGYLNVENPKKKLHYLFIESENDPKNDPLILWLNGGPGCSSLLGWAQEHGPASFGDESETFTMNPYSWHKLANIIYLESPAGVGFSYIDSKKDEDLYIDDHISGKENLEAVVDFFSKYPSLKSNNFYIAGESYAGIYVPTLAANIVDYNQKQVSSQKINLKGIMVGNGVTDWSVDCDNALVDFAFTHALYSPELRNKYINTCKGEKFDEKECDKIKDKIQVEVSKVNIYDIYRKCYNNNQNSNTTIFTNLANNEKSFLFKENLENHTKKIAKSSYRNYTPWLFSGALKKSSNNSKQNFLSFLEEKKQPLTSTPPCVDSKGPDAYFNRADVKLALNVRSDLSWGMCSEDVGSKYQRSEKGSYHLYPKLINSGLNILIYSGDTDGAVPINGTQRWISNLNLSVVSPWKSWKTDDINSIAGYRTVYKGLTFVTVKGTGHMVPQWKPKEAFHMLNRFLNGKDL
jgi:carboxypeptidase C (cathepsin A)